MASNRIKQLGINLTKEVKNLCGENLRHIYQYYYLLYEYIIIFYENYSAVRKKEILPFASAWIDLEGITLSEIHQTKTNIV